MNTVPWRRIAALLGVVLLGSCATLPPREPATVAKDHSAGQEWSQRYAALAAAGGTALRLDPQRSSIRILVFRGGRAPGLGHNHVLTAPEFTGYFFLPSGGTSGAQFDLEFPLDRLALDDPQMRARLGAPFAAELTPGDIANTRAHMLGPDNLQADLYPFIRLHSVGVAGEGEHFSASVEIELHGQRRLMTLPLTVDGLPGQIRAVGAFVLRQSEFGVRPYSALGGLIAVQDDVVIEFSLVGG